MIGMKFTFYFVSFVMMALAYRHEFKLSPGLRLHGGGRKKTPSLIATHSPASGQARKIAHKPTATNVEPGSDSDEINTKWLAASISQLFNRELPKIYGQANEGDRMQSNNSSASPVPTRSISTDSAHADGASPACVPDLTPERAALRRGAARLTRLDASLSPFDSGASEASDIAEGDSFSSSLPALRHSPHSPDPSANAADAPRCSAQVPFGAAGGGWDAG